MHHRRRTPLRLGAVVTSAVLGSSLALASPARADVATDTGALRAAVTDAGVSEHLKALQAIADTNGGNRAAGTSGHRASVDYVQGRLAAAGYRTWRQVVSYQRTDFGDSALQQVSPTAASYPLGTDFLPMGSSGQGDITAAVTAVDLDLAGDHASTSGCEASDFAGFPAGHLALLQRGSCAFGVKADNAAAAGAAGVVIFNQGNTAPGEDRLGLFGGTLGEPVRSLPVVSAPYALGARWAATPGLVLRLHVQTRAVQVRTENLLADTPHGRADRTVVVGGHLDSVAEGPGINDNGSGVAAILETALQLAALGVQPENRVRFAFWSGEEDGLVGSNYYVSQLSAAERQGTAVNLNFDMLGSPNAVNFVYDGDGDARGVAGPPGSGTAEKVFTDFFAAAGKPSEPTVFDGRSDYYGFIQAGIPAGGLFTGAEGIKSPQQAALFGGTAGAPFDPCYHTACDTVANVNPATLDLMADAVAHSTLTFAHGTPLRQGGTTPSGSSSPDRRSTDGLLRR